MRRLAYSALSAGLLATCANAFYLPGSAPRDYQRGERVELFVNALTPMIGVAYDAKLVRISMSTLLTLSYTGYAEISDKLWAISRCLWKVE